MKTEVLKSESWIVFLNSHTLKKPLPNLVTIKQLRQIWTPSNSSQMVTENANRSIEIHSCCLMVIKFIQCHRMMVEFSKHATMVNEMFLIAIRMWLPKGFWSPQSFGD
jgi:hypothetical protein